MTGLKEEKATLRPMVIDGMTLACGPTSFLFSDFLSGLGSYFLRDLARCGSLKVGLDFASGSLLLLHVRFRSCHGDSTGIRLCAMA